MMRRFGALLGILGLVGCGASVPGLLGAARPDLGARQASATLSLLTFNTFGLPAPLGRDLANRFSAMPSAVANHDVVGLQETFTGEAKRILDARIYPYGYRQDQGSWLHPLNSGLTILSRHPFMQPVAFRAFGTCATSDCFSRKGVLFARVDVPAVGPVDVYDTHYQAHAPYTRQRLQDNEDLAAFVREHDRGYPTFLLGDFNFLEDEDEYGDLAERLAPWDLFRRFSPNDPGYTCDPANPIGFSGGGEPERLDYIFYLPNKTHDAELLDSQVVLRNQPLSDHYAVRAKIRLSRKPG